MAHHLMGTAGHPRAARAWFTASIIARATEASSGLLKLTIREPPAETMPRSFAESWKPVLSHRVLPRRFVPHPPIASLMGPLIARDMGTES